MYKKTKYLLAGDSCLIMEFGSSIDPGINKRVRAAAELLKKDNNKAILEVVPTYRSLSVYYDPLETSFKKLIKNLKELEKNLDEEKLEKRRIIELPTLYGEDFGPDLDFISNHTGLSLAEIVELHTSRDYLVYMLGFTPGFPYLGGMDKRLSTPRLKNPRLKIPAGSVGLAGDQTGVYPLASPGGWQLIGRTPLRLFNPEKDPPAFLRAGDYLRFVSIDKKTYLDIEKRIEEGSFKATVLEGEGDELL